MNQELHISADVSLWQVHRSSWSIPGAASGDSPLGQLGEIGLPGEVPVAALDAAAQLHDVVTLAVPAGAHHPVQHQLEVVGIVGVADEEEPVLAAHTAVRHRLADHLHRLGARETVAWYNKHNPYI